MRLIAKILLVFGVAFIVYGTTRWQTTEYVTARSLQAFDDYAKTQQPVDAGSKGWDYPKELQRLKVRLSLAGGLYRGEPVFIMCSALGLIFIAVGYYLAQKKARSKEPAA